MGKAIRTLIGLLALALFCYSGWQLYLIYADYKAGTELYDSVASDVVVILSPEEVDAIVPQEPTVTTDPETGEVIVEAPAPVVERAPIAVDFDALLETNEDIVGWIYSEGTVINYPIVQSEDNSYYLHRMLDGKYNKAGTLFMDYRVASDFSDNNTLIYGHNMKNDSMFGTFDFYRDQEYYEEHPVMWLLTPERAYKVELFAGLVTGSSSEVYRFFDEEEAFRTHLEECVEKSTFTSQVDPETVERIVTLSTCSYEYDNARYVLLGSLIPVESAVVDPE